VTRKIFFVKYYDKGSTIMAADQISEALQARGVDAWSVYPADVAAVWDAVLVFIKTSKIHHLLAARRRGNRTVLDVQDTVVFKRGIKNRWLFDGLIFKNRRQVEDFAAPRRSDRTANRIIYHQWDPRYRENEVGDREFKIGYFGLRRSFPSWERFSGAGVAFCSDDYFRTALGYNCHLSLREPGRDFLYKPNCKVSTAAACGANLVTTRDESAVELLGEDYPYYGDPTPEGLLAVIDHARATFGGAEWKRGLERMREIKERTSMDRILDDYLDFFKSLD
jgi:hypothetical protein